jgi:hypothetical protein
VTGGGTITANPAPGLLGQTVVVIGREFGAGTAAFDPTEFSTPITSRLIPRRIRSLGWSGTS